MGEGVRVDECMHQHISGAVTGMRIFTYPQEHSRTSREAEDVAQIAVAAGTAVRIEEAEEHHRHTILRCPPREPGLR